MISCARVSLVGPRRALLALLALSLLLRVELVLGGGQRFFPDENRYLRCFILLRHIGSGDLGAATDYVLQTPDHTGFLAVGMLAALPQQALLGALGRVPDRPGVDATAWLPSLLFACASLLAIALVFGIARRAGAGEREALLASFLMACSTVMLVYSRHYFPYDAALALCLLALWLALAEGASLGRSLLVGLVAGAGFLTYNGYWLSAAAALVVHVLRKKDAREKLLCGAAAGLGLLALPALLTAIGVLRERGVFLRKMSRFSRLASTQSDFSEGWSLPWAYLWHAEHGLLLLFAAGALGVLCLVVLRGPEDERRRGLLFLAIAAGLYAAIVLFSTGLERIGAFGRQARQLVPPLCLASAAAAAPLLRTSRFARAWPLFVAALGVQAGYNFTAPLTLRFPRQLTPGREARYGALGRDTTVHTDPSPEETPQPDARFVLLNARYLYPVYGPKPAPPGRELFRTRHPLEYRPFQYEGFLPVERALLRSSDVAIRLLDTRPE